MTAQGGAAGAPGAGAEVGVPGLLEQRYRRILRWLPAGFRAEWEQDMVETFLTRAYASAPGDPEGVEISSPRWSEVASIAALAVRLRLGGVGAPPRAYAWGTAVRRFGLAGLLAHVVFAISGVALSVWTTRMPEVAGFATWWQAFWSMTSLLWLPAYLSVLFGHRRSAVLVALAVLAPAVITMGSRLRADQWAHPAYVIGWFIFDTLPVVALLGFHRGAPAPRPLPWIAAIPAGVAVLVVAELVARPSGATLWCVAATAACLMSVFDRDPAWPLAAALLAAAVLFLQLTVLLDGLGSDVFTGVTSALLLVAALVAALRAGALLRRLPQD